jgi:hypothetical protein
MKTYVVDVVVHLTISRSCTRRHIRRRLHTRSHVRFAEVSSTPSVQRGSGRRDPPDTPTPPPLLQVLVAYNFGSASLKQQPWWSKKVGDGRTKCLERGGVYPIYIGARGSHPQGVRPAPTPFLLFMVVVTPSFMER